MVAYRLCEGCSLSVGRGASNTGTNYSSASWRRVSRHRHRHAQANQRVLASTSLPRSPDGAVDWSGIDWNAYDWRDYVEASRGPAAEATLDFLDWPTLCRDVAVFAATSIGKQRSLELDVADTLERAEVRPRGRVHCVATAAPRYCEHTTRTCAGKAKRRACAGCPVAGEQVGTGAGARAVPEAGGTCAWYVQELQRETQAAELLETELAVSLDFGGINTDAASTGLRRAAKGGMLSGDILLGIAGLLAGAERLQRLMRGGRNAAHNTEREAAVEVLAGRCAAAGADTVAANCFLGTRPAFAPHTCAGCTAVCAVRSRARRAHTRGGVTTGVYEPWALADACHTDAPRGLSESAIYHPLLYSA